MRGRGEREQRPFGGAGQFVLVGVGRANKGELYGFGMELVSYYSGYVWSERYPVCDELLAECRFRGIQASKHSRPVRAANPTSQCR